MFEQYYSNILHTGDTKEVDYPIRHNVTFNNCNCFANKIHIEMFIKFIILFYLFS